MSLKLGKGFGDSRARKPPSPLGGAALAHNIICVHPDGGELLPHMLHERTKPPSLFQLQRRNQSVIDDPVLSGVIDNGE